MFAYCLNNPVSMYDPSGSYSLAAKTEDPLLDVFERYSGGGTSASANAAVAAAVGTVVVCGAKAISDAATAKQEPAHIYSVYFLYARDGDPSTIVYVGRVRTANKSARMVYHRSQGRELAYSIDGLTYSQCRAIEQGGMVYHHTINRNKKINNQIRGVSPTNGNRSEYFNAAQSMISSGTYPANSWLPASFWENIAENEWLNGVG